MRHLLGFMFTILTLSSCNQIKKDKIEQRIEPKIQADNLSVIKKEDTIKNYWALNSDTIVDKKEFEISNLKYSLELKTYSLYDSLIVRNLKQEDDQNYSDYSHTMVTDLNLISDSITSKVRIDKSKFEKSLLTDFYKDCDLYSTNLDSIVENKIYLTSDLAIPDTDNQWRVWYSLKIKNNQLEKLEVSNTDYVGL
ncbi:hypothetical protein ACNKXS_13185 [Christiangramia marina]|uniref:hypothetical protein n=1 Tax=Christiangramia marina TaxID=409436 RepID=UPI003AA85BE2